MPFVNSVQRSYVISATLIFNSVIDMGCTTSYMSNIHFTSAASSSIVSIPCLPSVFLCKVRPWMWSCKEDIGMPNALPIVTILEPSSTTVVAFASWSSVYVLVLCFRPLFAYCGGLVWTCREGAADGALSLMSMAVVVLCCPLSSTPACPSCQTSRRTCTLVSPKFMLSTLTAP